MPITSPPQFLRGKSVEAWLDDYFRADGWEIHPTTPREERVLCLGDRHFSRDGTHYFIEYKSGLQTFFSGNIFLETVSVDKEMKPGWVYTCKADLIFYAALLNHEILIFKPQRLRNHIEALKRHFKVVKTSHHQNDSYNTHGVLIPLGYAEAHLAEKVIRL